MAELVRLERVHNLLAGVQSRPRAVCGVANPRHSYGYVCGLRLAAHPDPHPAPLRAQIVNTFLKELYEGGSPTVATRLSQLLRDWLSLHIRRNDKEVRLFLDKQRRLKALKNPDALGLKKHKKKRYRIAVALFLCSAGWFKSRLGPAWHRPL